MPVWNEHDNKQYHGDWLVKPVVQKATIYKSTDGKDIILYNGLLKRSFRIAPNVVCTDFVNFSNGQQLLRALKPEAKIVIDNKAYNVGGLYGQTEKAYLLTDWLNQLKDDANDFHLVNITSGAVKPRLNWQCNTWAYNKKQPTGIELVFHYGLNQSAIKGITVAVHYELYDGIPLMVKWVEVINLETLSVVVI